MGSAQWSDLGMFLQTFMLLAVEAGLDTCPRRLTTVGKPFEFVELQKRKCFWEWLWKATNRSLHSLGERMAVDEWATWL